MTALHSGHGIEPASVCDQERHALLGAIASPKFREPKDAVGWDGRRGLPE